MIKALTLEKIYKFFNYKNEIKSLYIQKIAFDIRS